jgi:CPA1 family monovalent cation:H+ antiporter
VRLRGQPVWMLLTFLLNSSLFFLTGLQFRPVMLRLTDYSWDMLLMYGAGLTLVVIAIRFLWVFPASYLPRLFVKKRRGKDAHPPWQWSFLVAWSGMRGAISLAAAFAIPVAIGDYAEFPQRDLIVFLTFCVIIGTLVLQGAGLTPLVRWLRIDCHLEGEEKRNQEARHHARRHAAQAALDKIGHWQREKRFSSGVLRQLQERYSHRIDRLEDGKRISDGAARASLELIMVERETLIELRRRGDLSDNQLREIEADLDIMEMQVRRSRNAPF